ncbi:MAG TPA: zf-HC2 domain-containing protein [Bryobacteraceae bacterium]|jgi:hypothetical protein|nr:zf-HC2 domain-containing protein [Bryobacteraceae bacterium]
MASYLIPSNPPMNDQDRGAMDHRYIDEHSVASRYIENRLSGAERAAFEAHMVDCQECTDRILLAGIFHARLPDHSHRDLPMRARLAARLAPWQILVLFAITALLLVAIPALLIPIFVR